MGRCPKRTREQIRTRARSEVANRRSDRLRVVEAEVCPGLGSASSQLAAVVPWSRSQENILLVWRNAGAHGSSELG